eukprot:15472521-Alexandrium_andersonii.AAC.1
MASGARSSGRAPCGVSPGRGPAECSCARKSTELRHLQLGRGRLGGQLRDATRRRCGGRLLRTGRAGPRLQTAARTPRARKMVERFVRLGALRSRRRKSGGDASALTCPLGRGALTACAGVCPRRRARVSSTGLTQSPRLQRAA